MEGETLVWFFSTFLFVPLLCADSQYECGAHGKFEYCIDGIPGCVVGCHCHPGYYFDTDSKICEPNIKLTQDFRRNYLSQPTRAQFVPMTPSPDSVIQLTTQNAVDEKIDEIAKDADDLGDWLYNQFFKTIENQVINKTQDEQLPPTRRSGKVLLKPERRSHKYRRGRKKKKRSKGIKEKLLRITEDDSLFQSDSGSSIEVSSDASSESDSSNDEKIIKNNKDDHGHKEIIIFNKKPLPPLPSFIFLPNMDTPYYPPIGLPPPPVIPMYPMVPVPPMLPGPPMGHICPETEVKTTTTESPSMATESSSTTTELKKTSTTDPTPTESMPTESIPNKPITIEPESESMTTTTENSGQLRHRDKKRKHKPIERINNEQAEDTMKDRRDKLLKRLREKFNRKNKLENLYIGQSQDPEVPADEDEPLVSLPMNMMMNPTIDETPPKEEVNFKYLAELMHKANNLPNSIKNINNIPENIESPSRRNYYPTNNAKIPTPTRIVRKMSRMEEPNDSFYTNLGKQIATMIRKIDSKGEREVNIEIEGDGVSPQSKTSPVFNENNYASRSYWERSVRSPLKYMRSFKKEMDYLKKNNEDLFSLENQVSLAASTTRTLSLHDLETLINKVEKVRVTPRRKNKIKINKSNASFKFNLLPGNVQTIQTVGNIKPLQTLVKANSNNINPLHTRRKQSDASMADRFLLSNYWQLIPDNDAPITNTGTGKGLVQQMRPTRKPARNNNAILPPTNLHTNIIPILKASSKPNINYQPSPILTNGVKTKTSNKIPYMLKKPLPIQFTGLTQSFVPYRSGERPSYFHHEFQHFDFFDM